MTDHYHPYDVMGDVGLLCRDRCLSIQNDSNTVIEIHTWWYNVRYNKPALNRQRVSGNAEKAVVSDVQPDKAWRANCGCEVANSLFQKKKLEQDVEKHIEDGVDRSMPCGWQFC